MDYRWERTDGQDHMTKNEGSEKIWKKIVLEIFATFAVGTIWWPNNKLVLMADF